MSYETAMDNPPPSGPGRWAHLFEVRDGKISSYDWIARFSGTP
ncbi:MAG: hypothetical protein ACR2HB_08005 [Dehalococcoidia bacterium]